MYLNKYAVYASRILRTVVGNLAVIVCAVRLNIVRTKYIVVVIF